MAQAFLRKTTPTTCPYCGVGCGVLVHEASDGSVSIEGDPNHPANYGRLCSKGSALGETMSLDDRLLYPEVDGKRAEWNDALDLVADKFSQTIKEYGPDSVAFYVSGQILTEDYYVANKLMKGYIGSANIDTNSRLCMASSVAGHRKAFGTDTVPGTYEDLEEADLLILVGSNLAWCHPVIYQRVAAAKEKRPNMKVVLVDPRRTMTADLADVHLAIKPDGDSALFNGLLAHLSKGDFLDTDYINNYTNGFDAALDAASMLSLDDISKLTDLSEAELVDFYKSFEETEKVVTVYSQGVNQSSCGTDKVSSIINCHLATGRIGRAGMGPFSVTGQPNAMGGREVGGLANMLAAHMNIENEVHRDIVQRFWNSPTISDKQGLKAVDLFQAVADGKVKALWIMATNPVDSLPDADGVQDAIRNCPFVVVSDVLETTDTVRHAHVKLPATAWGEKDGTVTNSERRISRQKAFLEAPGDAKTDWWHLAEVGKRMGFEEAFDYRDGAAVFREFAAMSDYENDDTRDFNIGALADMDTKDYEVMSPFQWPLKPGETHHETRFFAEGDFYTPDRKGKFIPVEIKDRQVVSDDLPYVLNTGRIRDQWHTMTRTAKTARLSSHLAEPYCEIHPEDASALHLKDADLIRISNDYGKIVVRALVTDRQKKGHLFVPMHWTDQYASKARVDTLIPPLTDPFSGQPASKNVAVKAEVFAPKTYGFLVSRGKPKFTKEPYWAIAQCPGGWRAEFALNEDSADLNEVFWKLLGRDADFLAQSMSDQRTGNRRSAWFDGDTLEAAIYLSRRPVSASRSLLASWLEKDHVGSSARQKVVAGIASQDMPDKGAIICSCHNVGAYEIADAYYAGNHSVQLIGECTLAGTNCGSCRAEIQAIIDSAYAEAAE